jgi:hypothetical protein
MSYPLNERQLLVLLTGNDPVFLHYQCSVMPLYYKSVAEVLGLEPRRTESKSVMLPLHHTSTAWSRIPGSNRSPTRWQRVVLPNELILHCMVVPRGIEPRSRALQAHAMTTSAKAPY